MNGISSTSNGIRSGGRNGLSSSSSSTISTSNTSSVSGIRIRRLTPAHQVVKNGDVLVERLEILKEEEEGIHTSSSSSSMTSTKSTENPIGHHHHVSQSLGSKGTLKTTTNEQEPSLYPTPTCHKTMSFCNLMTVISRYLLPLRPWSFSASLTPVALGAVLSFKVTGSFNLGVFVASCLTVLAVHAAGNLSNTYYDYIRGVEDGEITKYKRKDKTTSTTNHPDIGNLEDQRLNIDELVHLGVVAYSIGCVAFLVDVLLSPARMEHLALIYFVGLSGSFLYAGRWFGLKYIGLGDLIILIIFGPISLLFSFLSQGGFLHSGAVLYAIPLALNTEAIFHSNNTRDMESDKKAGALTIAILLGGTLSHVLYALLLFVPYILFIGFGLHYSSLFFLPLITLPKAFELEKEFRRGDLSRVPRHTGTLNLYFGLFYVVACTFTDARMLPFLGR